MQKNGKEQADASVFMYNAEESNTSSSAWWSLLLLAYLKEYLKNSEG